MGGGCVKVCSECHSEVETGWQYCHTCGASSHSPVYRIAADGGTTVPDDLSSFDLPDSAFVAMLEGRAFGLDTEVDVIVEDLPPVPPTEAPAAAAPGPHHLPRLAVPGVPLTPHVIPATGGLSPRSQKVAAAVVVVVLVALSGLSLQLRSDLGATRARLQTTQEELDRSRGAPPASR